MSGAATSSPGCGPAGAEATVPVKRFRIGRYERKF